MSTRPLRLAVLTTCGNDSRSGPLVAQWFVREAEQYGDFEVDVVDLVTAELPVMITRPPNEEAERQLSSVTPRLAAADAFVVVTPEYNRAYPAVLKSAIDWHVAEWRAKPIGFVSYGGRSGGLRAIEQLHPVFAELHAVTLRDSVSFMDVWDQFGSDGLPKDGPGCSGAAKVMLDQLKWWAASLHDARLSRPYRV
ncbi:NADPH-dependent FMN reductase [Streptomyces sp. CA-249302]|uniref:NADPH-dependent FMN reductase n=1 Tax=Streptomyces sp. CA-249302 TaxID=3240058 RepID=UPI003D8DC545